MSRKQKNPKRLEERVADMVISYKSKECSTKDLRENVECLGDFIRNRGSSDSIVTKHIFNKLNQSGMDKDQIVEVLMKTGCPLDLALQIEEAEITRMILERIVSITKAESSLVIQLAMKSSYLDNIKALVQYGPDADERSRVLAKRIFDNINSPNADLEAEKSYIQKLMAADIIDIYSFKFVEKTFEMGKIEVIKMLFDCKIDEYVKAKLGEEVLVHLFRNRQVDVLRLIHGKRFYVNGKCGGMGALHFATMAHSENSVRLLLRAGADPNIRDCNGMTPLFAFGDRMCIDLLLRNGADVQSIADNGYTILDMIFKNNLLALMLAHIALIEAQGTTIKPEIRNKIVSKPNFHVFYDKCRKQIQHVRRLHTNHSFILSTALIGKSETIACFVTDNAIVNELINECRNLQVNSHYLITMERNINKALYICQLRTKTVKILLPIFKQFQFDEFTVGKIVDYLTYEELLMTLRFSM